MIKQHNINTRFEFILPSIYTNGTLEEIEECLWAGAFIHNNIKTFRSSNEIKKITELKDNEIARIQGMYNEKLTKLLDDIRGVTVEKERLESEYSKGLKEARSGEREVVGREWEEKLRLLRKDNEILQGRYESLEERRRVLEEGRAADIKEAVRRTEELMEKLVASKQEQLLKMELAYNKLNETIQKQSEEISRLSGHVSKRSANVKTKGSDYEEEFGEKLRRSYGLCRGFKLKDTRLGMGHEMDFAMEMDGHAVMWELKNYGNIVPKAEVEKFLRDLKENPQAKIGVMISRATDIYGKNGSGPLCTEFDNDKMMIYINRFEEFCGEDENRVFQLLGSLFRIWWEYHREENNVFDRVEIIRELEKAVEEVSKRRTEWRRHKAHLDELGRWTADLLEESEARIDRLLKKVRNVEEAVNDRPLDVPEGVFRESGEEKELSWIKSVMKVCEAGGEIEVRELVELLGAHHKLSKDTIRSNVMSIIRDSAVIKKGVVKYIKGISKFVPKSMIKV
jgi:hypothetical protein